MGEIGTVKSLSNTDLTDTIACTDSQNIFFSNEINGHIFARTGINFQHLDLNVKESAVKFTSQNWYDLTANGCPQQLKTNPSFWPGFFVLSIFSDKFIVFDVLKNQIYENPVSNIVDISFSSSKAGEFHVISDGKLKSCVGLKNSNCTDAGVLPNYEDFKFSETAIPNQEVYLFSNDAVVDLELQSLTTPFSEAKQIIGSRYSVHDVYVLGSDNKVYHIRNSSSISLVQDFNLIPELIYVKVLKL